jgi:hypothetical protein
MSARSMTSFTASEKKYIATAQKGCRAFLVVVMVVVGVMVDQTKCDVRVGTTIVWY